MFRISKLWNLNDEYKERLVNLLFKYGFRYVFKTRSNFRTYLESLINGDNRNGELEIFETKSMDDKTILRKLRTQYIRHKKPICTDDYIRIKQNRAELRWKDINKVQNIAAYDDFTCYLDFGCGDCSTAVLLGKKMGLYKSRIYGLDIDDWDGAGSEDLGLYQSQCKYTTYDGVTLPYPDRKFDVITAFQVLHHISDIRNIIKELHRCLKIGGFLIIREQHCADANMEELIRLEHVFQNQVFASDPIDEECFGKYRRRKRLKKIIKEQGFLWQGKYCSDNLIWNPTNCYYEIYVRL